MSYYECKKCLYKCKQKCDIIKHLHRKNKCIKIPDVYIMTDEELYNNSLIKNIKQEENNIEKINKSFECHNCKKIFCRNDSLTRHISKYCKIIEKEENIEKPQTINHITNITNNNQNIINFNINLIKSFDEDWDTSNIDNFLKFALMISSNKYTNTLRSILDNDCNLNVILNKNNEYGLIYDKDDNKFTNMKIKKIVELSMNKINKHLEQFYKELDDNFKNINIDIDKDILELVKTNIDNKYNNYINDTEVKKNVDNIISDIYYNKYDYTKKLCNDILIKNNISGY